MDHQTQTTTEQRHFDDLIRETEATWWGDRTPAARVREMARVRLIGERLHPVDGSLIIDAGCGIGNLSGKLADAFPRCRLVCVDLSPQAIDVARQRHGHPNIEYRVGDCANLPADLRVGRADFVVGRSILHHLPDLAIALRGFAEALKTGGRLFFSEPNPHNPHTFVVSRSRYLQALDQWSEGERPIQANRLRIALEQSGLYRKVSVEPFDFVHPALPLRLAQWVDRMNKSLSRVPLVRKLAGSLIVVAERAPRGDT